MAFSLWFFQIEVLLLIYIEVKCFAPPSPNGVRSVSIVTVLNVSRVLPSGAGKIVLEIALGSLYCAALFLNNSAFTLRPHSPLASARATRSVS